MHKAREIILSEVTVTCVIGFLH